jgi:DEAD/DEAH box helicase domain-containing protein
VSYFTDALVKRDIKVLHEDSRSRQSGVTAVIGDILVRTQVAKFKKIRYHSHENVGYGDISLPEEEMHTRAVALLFEEGTLGGEALGQLPEAMITAAISRIGAVIRRVSPVFLLCDERDIGVAERLRDLHFAVSCLYVYDNYPGGTGLAEAFLPKAEAILLAAFELIDQCPCEEGCPSCVGPRDPNEELPDNPKEAVLTFLRAWLSAPAA